MTCLGFAGASHGAVAIVTDEKTISLLSRLQEVLHRWTGLRDEELPVFAGLVDYFPRWW